MIMGLKHILIFIRKSFFLLALRCLCHQTILLCVQKRKNKIVIRSHQLDPGLQKALQLDWKFVHTLYYGEWKNFLFDCGAVVKPGIKLMRPEIGRGKLFWDCRYQHKRANNIILNKTHILCTG